MKKMTESAYVHHIVFVKSIWILAHNHNNGTGIPKNRSLRSLVCSPCWIEGRQPFRKSCFVNLYFVAHFEIGHSSISLCDIKSLFQCCINKVQRWKRVDVMPDAVNGKTVTITNNVIYQYVHSCTYALWHLKISVGNIFQTVHSHVIRINIDIWVHSSALLTIWPVGL